MEQRGGRRGGRRGRRGRRGRGGWRGGHRGGRGRIFFCNGGIRVVEASSDSDLEFELTQVQLSEASGGYDEAFVECLDVELECSICLLAMRDPVLTICGHKFCKSCLSKLAAIDGTARCCQCRQELDAASQTFPANDCRRKILSLKVKCRQREDGCDWVGELRRIETHQTECRAVKVWCENECGESVLRWQMDDHLEQTCSKRLTECKYCREEMPADEIAKHHSVKCSEMPVACTHCHKTMERRKIKKHVSSTVGDCADVPLNCCYADMGCKFVCTRKLMDEHLHSKIMYHSQLLVQEVKTLSKFKVSMETYVRSKEPPGTIIWAFQLPYEGQILHAFTEESPVYTCDGGYKMSFTVSQFNSIPRLSLFANMSPQESEEEPIQHDFPTVFECCITDVNLEESREFVLYRGYLAVDNNEEKDIKIADIPNSYIHHENGTVLLKIRLTHDI